jgi:hypothetical protein
MRLGRRSVRVVDGVDIVTPEAGGEVDRDSVSDNRTHSAKVRQILAKVSVNAATAARDVPDDG